jgi:NADPH-dependent 2,4-dienoyl-CoA reductase/sulfur reductase-like enzyme
VNVVIIGNGITGVTAALRLRERRPDCNITIVSGESTYHYSRPALMYLYMGHMTWADTKPYEDDFWKRQRLDLVRGWVTGVDVSGRRITLHGGGSLAYDKLLIATGSKSNKFGWPGQDLPGVQGFYDLMDLRLLHENTVRAEHAVIVGGGLIGIELAEMLHSRNLHVTFLVREKYYWNNILPSEESKMICRIIRAAGMDLRLSTNLKEIVDDGTGRVTGVVTDTGDRIDCQLVGLTPGVSPNIDLVKDSPIATGRGVLVDLSLRTNVPDIFAAGDCAEIVTPDGERNLIQQVWYTGKAQGRVVGDVLAGDEREYEPGIWYNSAKFLDLEYQTYGFVSNEPREGERHLWWEHPDHGYGIRIVHDGRKVTGFNLMGIRYRHEVCERWIREERPIEYVLDRLAEANFDPELYRRHESKIVPALRAQIARAAT